MTPVNITQQVFRQQQTIMEIIGVVTNRDDHSEGIQAETNNNGK